MNPFPASDPDRHAIWEMLVERDIQAFVAADWNPWRRIFLPMNSMASMPGDVPTLTAGGSPIRLWRAIGGMDPAGG